MHSNVLHASSEVTFTAYTTSFGLVLFFSVQSYNKTTHSNLTLKCASCSIVLGHCSLNAPYMYSMLKLGSAWLFSIKKGTEYKRSLEGMKEMWILNHYKHSGSDTPPLQTVFPPSHLRLAGRGRLYQNLALFLHVDR